MARKRQRINWEPDVRKALEQLNSTGGNLQREVDRLAREQRENAVSPADIVANAPLPPANPAAI